MSKPMEQQLRDLFTEDADRAPHATFLAEGVLRLVRQRRRRARLLWATVATVMTVVVAVSVGVGVMHGRSVGTAGPSPIGQKPHGAVPGAASCVEGYSVKALINRAFAFDGTIIAISPPRTNRPGAKLSLVAATFHVNEWFHGGSKRTVTVDMAPPQQQGASAKVAPSYRVGTRLLVSGEPRWGGGAPLGDAIAWGCGFTRYYDPATANIWRAAFH
jgi:hypothetical protein